MPEYVPLNPEVRRINNVLGVHYNNDTFNALTEEDKYKLRNDLQEMVEFFELLSELQDKPMTEEL